MLLKLNIGLCIASNTTSIYNLCTATTFVMIYELQTQTSGLSFVQFMSKLIMAIYHHAITFRVVMSRPNLFSCFRSLSVIFTTQFMANPLPNILTIDNAVCANCRVDLAVTPNHHDRWIQLVSRGLETPLHFSELHGDNDFQMFLASKPTVVNVHTDCPKKYTSKSKRHCEQQQKKCPATGVCCPSY